MKKRGKKGLSDIVSTLLLILLVLVAVGIVWIFVRNIVQQGSEQISLGKLTLDLRIEQVQRVNDSALSVKVKRNVGDGEYIKIRFILDDGDNTEAIDVNSSLSELAERTYVLPFTKVNISNIKSIQIIPIFLLSSGKEVAGDVKDEYTVPSTGLTGGSSCVPSCPTGAQCGYDGCGGFCGTCGAGETCTNYQCTTGSCTPSCIGRECGSDGCSGSCGTCSLPNANSTCSATFQCTLSSCINSDYANCDGNVTNGCEVLLGTTSNCASCGNVCTTGQTCVNNVCIGQTCTDTCSSLGYTCGTYTICNASVNCGTCPTGQSCIGSVCVNQNTTCTDTCFSLGYGCGTQTICGVSTDCGTCATGYTCVGGYCELPCTETCTNLGYECGTQTVCGVSTDCGTCGTGYTCTAGTCVASGPQTSWDTYASGSRSAYGITTDGNYFWITDHNQFRVYRFYFNGTYSGTYFDTSASGANYPSAISVQGGYLWIQAYYDNSIFRYITTGGIFTGLNWSYGSYFGNAWGMTQNGTDLWTLSTFRVDHYLMDGTHLGFFSTESTDNVNGFDITNDATYFWITDTVDDEIYKYYINGTYTGLHIDTAATGNADPYGIVVYGNYLYVTDPVDDEVYIYNKF